MYEGAATAGLSGFLAGSLRKRRLIQVQLGPGPETVDALTVGDSETTVVLTAGVSIDREMRLSLFEKLPYGRGSRRGSCQAYRRFLLRQMIQTRE